MKNIQKRMTAIVFLLTLILLPVMTIFSGKESFSSVENRTLQKKPSLSAESWFDKSFMKDFEAYVSDHFTGRIRWIDAKINTELLTGKKEINGIYITDERLIEKIPEPDYEAIDKSVDAINTLASSVTTPVYVMISPTSAGIYTDTLPKNAPQLDQKQIIDYIYKNLNTGVSAIDVYDILNASLLKVKLDVLK